MASSLIAQLGYRPRTTVWATSLERRSQMSGMAAKLGDVLAEQSALTRTGEALDQGAGVDVGQSVVLRGLSHVCALASGSGRDARAAAA